MFLREFFEAVDKTDAAFAFGRFNPAHQGHVEVYKAVEAAGNKWFIGTNPNTHGANDPLTFDEKSAWMTAIYPGIEGHIIPEQSVLTVASRLYEMLGDDRSIAYVTDTNDWAWSGKLLNDYNGKQGPHGYYKFTTIKHVESPRVSSATALRTAARAGDEAAFYAASGTDPKLTVNGKTYFETVVAAVNANPEKVKKAAKKKTEKPGSKFNDNPNDDWSADFERRMKQGVAEGERIKTPSGMYRDQHTGVAYRGKTGQDGNDSYMTPDYLIQKYQERLAQIASGPYKRPKEVAQLKSRIAKLQGQKQGVAEGGVLKSIKRGLKGWQGSSHLDDIKDYVRNASDKTLLFLYKNPGESPYKQTPRDIQIKLINRELKRRYGIKPGEPGVAEGSVWSSVDQKMKHHSEFPHTHTAAKDIRSSMSGKVIVPKGTRLSELGNNNYLNLDTGVQPFKLDSSSLEKPGAAEGSSTTWEVNFDYGPHMSDSVKVKADSEEEAIAKVEKAAERKGRSIMINWAEPVEQDMAESMYDTGFKIGDWEYRTEVEDYDDVTKIFHYAIKPNGGEISIDFSPYSTMTKETFKLWVKAGMPTRKDLGKRGPLDNEDIIELSNKGNDNVIPHMVKDLENPPKVMQHRAKRDQERDQQLKGRDIAKKDNSEKDQWGNLKDSLRELSSELLGKYKKKASADATDSDKKGDFKRGDKRYSGIIKATKKQFDNDLKGKK